MLVTGIDTADVNDLRDFGGVLIQKGAADTAVLNVVAFQRVNASYVQPVQARTEVKLRQ
jgi:hypothetical protein